jgi:hypothetical protein
LGSGHISERVECSVFVDALGATRGRRVALGMPPPNLDRRLYTMERIEEFPNELLDQFVVRSQRRHQHRS